ncbi:hypothetical protein [Pseudoalteromonas rubra]|uniref:Uncharacterized protein n=1 Tax=Pseudoalteromonas rubra TaxID=43658 RepID=A0A0F4QJR5_9GAMM|nr:hypothetical protein [Pseudoalteromonas rubra]KJZ07928.1 hypothetical protein TW77_13755 [Pseudoalteromonas rubra]
MKLFRAIDELEISGTVSELAEIKRTLEKAEDGQVYVFTFDCSGCSMSYDSLEPELKVQVCSGPACATFREEGGVTIRGGLKSIEVFASFFDFDLDSASGEHYHWDEACGSEYVATNSIPMVVSVA